MNILYSYKEGTTPVYISDGGGVQRVLLTFKDNNNIYVYFCDDYLRHTYLNKIINPLSANFYSNANLARIDSDEEFYHYQDWISRNYNYNGTHVEEKIDGHDQGGAVLVDTNGKPLIK